MDTNSLDKILNLEVMEICAFGNKYLYKLEENGVNQTKGLNYKKDINFTAEFSSWFFYCFACFV